MLIVFIRAIILYILIIFSIRLMGKRQLGELQPSELVVTILVSNIATLPIEDINIPLVMGVIPILTLVCLDVLMSLVTLKYRKIRKLVSGSAKIIISDGVLDQKMLKELRYSTDDVMESLRGLEIFDISQVQYAIVETTGKISAYLKDDYQPLTSSAITSTTPKNPPEQVIDDGKLIAGSLSGIRKSEGWLFDILRKENTEISDVFYLSADKSGKYTLIRKENSKSKRSKKQK